MTDTSRRPAMFVLVVVLVVLVVVLGAAASVISQEEPTKTKLMRAKSGYSHRLLDAVVQEDFETVRDQAFRLKVLAGTADWKIVDTRAYVLHSESFIRETERLRKAADEEDGDAVATAFMDMMRTCVSCHRYLKTQQN